MLQLRKLQCSFQRGFLREPGGLPLHSRCKRLGEIDPRKNDFGAPQKLYWKN